MRTRVLRTARQVRTALGQRLYRPSHLRVLMNGALSAAAATHAERHLHGAVAWIKRMHDVGGGQGVSASYSFGHGFFPPYPETTGYIIPTLLDVRTHYGDGDAGRRAFQMAAWLAEIQMECGAIQAGYYGPDPSGMLSQERPQPSVFNTGQVMLGWNRCYREVGDVRCRDASLRAARWLVSLQGPDGSWPRGFTRHPSNPGRSYETRVAWALIEAGQLLGERHFLAAGRRAIEWALSRQQPNGWVQGSGFTPEDWAFTHTIAYVCEGILEGALLLGQDDWIASVGRVLEPLRRAYEGRPFLPGIFDGHWRHRGNFSCLTGSAQVSGLWLRYGQLVGEAGFVEAGRRLNDFLMRTQNLTTRNPGIRGGIAGSYPIYGEYCPWSHPNWAAKFFVDSLLIQVHGASGAAWEAEAGDVRRAG